MLRFEAKFSSVRGRFFGALNCDGGGTSVIGEGGICPTCGGRVAVCRALSLVERMSAKASLACISVDLGLYLVVKWL